MHFRLKKTMTQVSVLTALLPSLPLLVNQALAHERPVAAKLDPATAPARGAYAYHAGQTVVRTGVTGECVTAAPGRREERRSNVIQTCLLPFCRRPLAPDTASAASSAADETSSTSTGAAPAAAAAATGAAAASASAADTPVAAAAGVRSGRLDPSMPPSAAPMSTIAQA